jgi:ABC-type sugar transport system ATPase subunit
MSRPRENVPYRELRNVTKRVGAETFIHATNLVFEQGSFNILLGTTLAGKTTLMQLMAGLEQPTSGEIWYQGKNVARVPVQKRNVSMVYQQFINYPNFNVYDNIASPLRVARMAGGNSCGCRRSPTCCACRRCCSAGPTNSPAASSSAPPSRAPW